MEKTIAEKLELLKRDLYLEVAAKIFDEVGYENVTVSDLADSFDISVGTFYKIFETKENLYFEYILYQFRTFVERLEDNSTDDPIQNLKLFLHYTYEPFIKNKKGKSINISLENDPFFFHNLNTNDSQPMDGLYKYLAKQFEEILKNEKIDCYHTAVLFKKLADGYTQSYMIKKFDTTNVIDDTITLFFSGIAKISKQDI
ncbi:TetR/AcrR family transcriptional regulator [Sulfurimonas aquatica]|nr:TetR/AcrR family transcriptional regulator [Sulfurimonas aquatica]